MYYLLGLSQLPIVLLFCYVYGRDTCEREPLRLLFYCFSGGILGFPVAAAAEFAFEAFLLPSGLTPALYNSIQMFLGVALIEEACKLAAIMLLVYRKPEFNEPFDGIVYAVAVSLGFAAIENALYCIGFGIEVAWYRMFSAVPMHAMSAVLLGFYVGRAKFERDERGSKLLIWCGLLASTLAHGGYNYFLSFEDATYFLLAMFLLFMQILLAHRAMRIYNAQHGVGIGAASVYLPEQDRHLVSAPITWAIFALGLLASLGTLWSAAAFSGILDAGAFNRTPEELLHAAFLISLVSVLSFAAVRGLSRRRPWAWKYALTVFIVSIPSPLFVVSAAGVFGLFHPESRKLFSADLR